MDYLGEGFDDFEYGNGGIGVVGKDDIDVGLLEVGKWWFEIFDDVFVGEIVGVWFFVISIEEDFGGEDVFIVGLSEFFESLFYFDFRFVIGICFGCVEGLLIKFVSYFLIKFVCELWIYNIVILSSLENFFYNFFFLGVVVCELFVEWEKRNL